LSSAFGYGSFDCKLEASAVSAPCEILKVLGALVNGRFQTIRDESAEECGDIEKGGLAAGIGPHQDMESTQRLPDKPERAKIQGLD
jgi:hypothetical protein